MDFVIKSDRWQLAVGRWPGKLQDETKNSLNTGCLTTANGQPPTAND